MIAAEFNDHSLAQVENRANDHKFRAVCLVCAGGLSARIISLGHPESLT
jgi:hypothetical protein